MKTCDRCGCFFDPKLEGSVQADLFSTGPGMTLCGICYHKREREEREAEAARRKEITKALIARGGAPRLALGRG